MHEGFSALSSYVLLLGLFTHKYTYIFLSAASNPPLFFVAAV